MKKAYIIAAHKNPEQLNRLISRLDDGNATFFIHIDKKANLDDFKSLEQFGDKIKMVERVVSRWATMGQVQSTLNAMEAIVAAGEPYKMITFLSGQDYPIKTNAAIDQFFETSPHSVFIEYYLLPNYERWGQNGGMWRINKYFFGVEKNNLYLSKAANLTAKFLPFLRRKLPENMKPYLGSAWFSMDLEAVKYVLKYIKDHPEFVRFQKYAFSPDELFYLMILVNSPEENIRSKVVNDNKRLINWERASAAHPETLTANDFEQIYRSDALFARKFDPKVDTRILDMIDEKILSK